MLSKETEWKRVREKKEHNIFGLEPGFWLASIISTTEILGVVNDSKRSWYSKHWDLLSSFQSVFFIDHLFI